MGLLRHCSWVLTDHHKPLRAIKRARRATGSAQHMQQESKVRTMVHGMSLNRHPSSASQRLEGFEKDICMLSEMPLKGQFQGCPRAEIGQDQRVETASLRHRLNCKTSPAGPKLKASPR